MNPKPSLPQPCLMLVTDRRRCHHRALPAVVATAVDGGVNAVQLREKGLPAGELWELACQLRQVTQGRALLLINDRLDVALAVGADGVQLPEDSLPVTAARRVSGDGLLIGRSVHSLEGAVQAEREGADFLVVGTIFATPSHPDVVPGGAEFLALTRSSTRLPLLAIGGIGRDNVREVVAAGADGCAIISAILATADPHRAASELRAALDAAWQERRTATRVGPQP